MRRNVLFVLLMSLALPCLASVKEPTNLYYIERKLMQYHDSGMYMQQISEVAREARYYLRFRLTDNARLKHPKKLAMVLDIDETALSNYTKLKHLRFGGSNQDLRLMGEQPSDPAIKPILNLYNFAKANNIAVFFVTGRNEFLRQPTIENLHDAGYKNWNGLYLKPNTYKKQSVVPYKSGVRKQITKLGYDVVLTMGDQESDLQGGYADFTLKIPDPFYHIA